jgi:F0F1-type ATP synthase membrane subunit b/b'
MKTPPTVRTQVVIAVLGFLLILGSVAIAQRPRENVSRARHPNIAAAQRLCEQAWQRIVTAQQANEFDMQGHAQKAKELLDQANRELKLAAETANRNAR